MAKIEEAPSKGSAFKVFGIATTDSVRGFNDLDEVNKPDEVDLGFVLARVYGFSFADQCRVLKKPLPMFLPNNGVPANSCGFLPPYQVWSLSGEDEYKIQNLKIHGIDITFRNVRVEGTVVKGTVEVRVEIAGGVLIDQSFDFAFNGEYILFEVGAFGFSAKGIIYVSSFDPPSVCLRIELRGPLGYKDEKTVCS